MNDQTNRSPERLALLALAGCSDDVRAFALADVNELIAEATSYLDVTPRGDEEDFARVLTESYFTAMDDSPEAELPRAAQKMRA